MKSSPVISIVSMGLVSYVLETVFACINLKIKGTIKSSIRKIIGHSLYPFDEFLTLSNS
jgi:hypothetical protein